MTSKGSGASFVLIISLCCIVGVFDGFNLVAPSVTASELRRIFNLSASELGAFFSAGTSGLLIGAATGGILSDRYGRKAILIISTLAFAIGSLANGFATSIQTLIACRLFTGIGMGSALPNLIAIASEGAPAGRKGQAVGMVLSSTSIGGAIISFVAGIAVVLNDWRLVYFVGAAAPLLFLPALLYLLPASSPSDRRTGAGPISEIFAEGRAQPTAFLWLGSLLLMVTIYLLSNWLPSLLQARGISHQGTLRVQLVFSLGGIAGGVFAGWLLDRPGMRRIVGVVGLYAAYMAAIFALAEAPPVETVIAIIGCLLGILVAAVASVLYALAPQLYPARIRGSGVGLGVTAGRVGAIIGPLFAGALLSAGLTAATVLTLMLPLVAIAGWCAVVIAIGVLPGAGRRAAD